MPERTRRSSHPVRIDHARGLGGHVRESCGGIDVGFLVGRGADEGGEPAKRHAAGVFDVTPATWDRS